jgi:diguanylate cyclase (GGDEF)-like protein
MKFATEGKRAGRFILSQLGASALVLAVLFMIPISMLLQQQVRESEAVDAVTAQTQTIQEISRLAEAIVRAGNGSGRVGAVASLLRRVRANEPRISVDLPLAMQRGLAQDVAAYGAAAGRLHGDGADAAAYHELVDSQIDLMQKLAATERYHLDRTRDQSTSVYAIVGCAFLALLMLLASGWSSLWRSSRTEVKLLEAVAEADLDEAQLTRIEELYLVVASSGVDASVQVERALAYARTTLAYEWAVAIEWHDGEEAKIAATVSVDLADPKSSAGFSLEKAIVLDASRAGAPVTFRIDRLPGHLLPLASAPRPFAWRHSAAYAFPGDFTDREPHCAIFLGTRQPRSEGLSEADQQLMRLIGTLLASSARNARHQKRLDDLAFADPLTGMPNRALLREQLETTIAASEIDRRRFAIHFIDLDGFKNVNDADGHEVGDEVLKIAATRMGKVLRDGEFLARIGGDEFVVLQTTVANAGAARELADRIIERLATPFIIDGRKHRIGGSIGIAMYPDHGRTSTELLRHADSALYASKRNGKGCASFYAAAPSAAIETTDVVA